jgi:single-stranded DNA-binding protein
MSVAILLQGRLERAPETRTSRNGNTFAMATMRVAAGSEIQFWRCFVFSESAAAELQRLREGDALAVQGTPKFEIYTPDGGAARISLSLTADHVLPLKQPPKERKPKEKGPHTEKPSRPDPVHHAMNRHGGDGGDEFGDEIPF